MPLYRIFRTLDIGKGRVLHPGGFTRLEWVKPAGREILVERGAVGEVSAPPLGILKGWKTRAEKLLKLGIVDVVELLETSPDELAKKMNVKPATVKRWQDDAQTYLTAPPPRSG